MHMDCPAVAKSPPEADEGKGVARCTGVPGLSRRSRYNRRAKPSALLKRVITRAREAVPVTGV